jgi:hypothetical protein
MLMDAVLTESLKSPRWTFGRIMGGRIIEEGILGSGAA